MEKKSEPGNPTDFQKWVEENGINPHFMLHYLRAGLKDGKKIPAFSVDDVKEAEANDALRGRVKEQIQIFWKGKGSSHRDGRLSLKQWDDVLYLTLYSDFADYHERVDFIASCLDELDIPFDKNN